MSNPIKSKSVVSHTHKHLQYQTRLNHNMQCHTQLRQTLQCKHQVQFCRHLYLRENIGAENKREKKFVFLKERTANTTIEIVGEMVRQVT